MIDYPNKLNIIFEKLDYFNIKPIIIGGYIRDSLLKIPSKDIDIELYGLSSLEKLETILQEFGSLNSVGKSFGVCKLKYEELDIDFSLPRQDSKIASGHRGFFITTDKNLDFKTACSRRDFRLNAIGYDVQEKKLLDPFHGIEDIHNKIIRAVDLDKFAQDPLRVLRAVVFSSRLGFEIEQELFVLCKSIIKKNILQELPKERIFSEMQKLLLKSHTPSIGLNLLNILGCEDFFGKFDALKEVDAFAIHKTGNDAIDLFIFLALLYSNKSRDYLDKLTNEVSLKKEITAVIHAEIDINNYSNYDIYLLAMRVNIEIFTLYEDASTLYKNSTKIEELKNRAKKLQVLHKPLKALLQGRDLIALGLKPSALFSQILQEACNEQMHETFCTHAEAIEWLKKRL